MAPEISVYLQLPGDFRIIAHRGSEKHAEDSCINEGFWFFADTI